MRDGSGPSPRAVTQHFEPMPRRSVSTRKLAYYRSHFLEALREDGVVCLECGGLYKSLALHIIATHYMEANEYRAKWGYRPNRPLAAPALRETQRQHARRRGLWRLRPPDLAARGREAFRRLPRPRPPGSLESQLNRRRGILAREARGWHPGSQKVDAATLQALVAEGLTSRAIAQRTGLKLDTVQRRIRKLGLTGPGIPPLAPKVNKAELIALCRAGLWPSEIAARLGLRPKVVTSHLYDLRQQGVTLPRPTGPIPTPRRRATDEQLLALAREGLPTSEIAARLGLARATAKARLASLRRRGLLPALKRRVFSLKEDERLLALRAAGLWNQEIASRMGLPVNAITDRVRALRRRGLAVATPATPVVTLRRRVQDDQLLAWMQEGLRPSQIAARVGLSAGAIVYQLRALRRRGVEVRTPKGPWPPTRERVSNRKLLALARAGLRSGAIARQVHRDPSTVRDWLRALRQRGLLPPIAVNNQRRFTDEQLLALRSKGLSYEAMAARFGVSPGTVHRRAQRLERRGLLRATRRRTSRDAQIAALVRKGLGFEAVADRVGMKLTALYQRLRALRRRGLLPPHASPDPGAERGLPAARAQGPGPEGAKGKARRGRTSRST